MRLHLVYFSPFKVLMHAADAEVAGANLHQAWAHTVLRLALQQQTGAGLCSCVDGRKSMIKK